MHDFTVVPFYSEFECMCLSHIIFSDLFTLKRTFFLSPFIQLGPSYLLFFHSASLVEPSSSLLPATAFSSHLSWMVVTAFSLSMPTPPSPSSAVLFYTFTFLSKYCVHIVTWLPLACQQIFKTPYPFPHPALPTYHCA